MQDTLKQILIRQWRRSERKVRLVIDTNLFVSGLLNPHGPSSKLIELLPKKRYQLLTSKEILTEYKDVINRFSKISHTKRNKLIGKIKSNSLLVKPKEHFPVIKDDPDDNKFIECAVCGSGNFIVTNDKHLLDLKEFGEIYIVTLPTINEIMDW